MDSTLNVQPDIIVKETVDGQPVDTSSVDRKNRRRVRKKAHAGKADTYIWGIYIVLLIISIIESYSASSTEVTGQNIYKPLIDQVKFLGAGFVIVLFLQRVHYKWFKYYATAFFIFCFLLLIYSTLFGQDLNGAKRAINLGFFSLQPPELMKLAMVLFLAKTMGVNQRPGGVSMKGTIISVVAVTAACGLLWFNGLTNAAMVMIVSICMFLIGGIEWKKLGVIVLIYAGMSGIIYVTKYSSEDKDKTAKTEQVEKKAKGSDIGRVDTQKGRMTRFIEGVTPQDSITDDNRQVMFSHFAIAHGQWFGNKPGASRESTRLPLAYSDYIFSIIVEDTGFIGGVALLILYLCLLGRAGRIASKCRRAFPALLIMGCAVMIVLQALVNMIIAVGIGPVSGQPLPLISRGGTSIMVMSTAIGMMLSVSRYAIKGNGTRKEEKEELNELPEDLQAVNPTMVQ